MFRRRIKGRFSGGFRMDLIEGRCREFSFQISRGFQKSSKAFQGVSDDLRGI